MEPLVSQFEQALNRVWRTLALRGLLAVCFGIVVLAWPDISLRTMVLSFGVFVAAHGVVGVIAAVRARIPARQRLWLLLQGGVSVGFGIVAFTNTDMTQRALLYCVGAWAIGFGLVEIVAAVRLPIRRNVSMLVGITGLLSIVFGLVMFVRPDTGALAFAGLVAALAITTGVTMTLYAVELRGAGREIARRVRSVDATTPTATETAVQS
jgi:uncharacterized membrane protein HdeD (DUF308 family)